MLFVLSLLFYGWGEPLYVLLMMLSITTAYLFGFLIEKNRTQNPGRAKRAMIWSLAINLSFLFFFKYYNFFAQNLSLLPFVNIPTLEGLKLPIGISFYTFQIMSYTIDLYRNDCKLQKSYVAFGTYVTLFPQLIAGPIVRYRDVDRQLAERRERMDDFASGVARFCVGLSKKVLVGDMLAAGNEYFKASAALGATTLGAWLTVICFTLHLYYDFSGYSDMAIGLGRMLGFHFPENIKIPYFAFLYCAIFLGEVKNYYITVPLWDDLLHGFSGVMAGLFAFMLTAVALSGQKEEYLRIPPAFIALFAFVFSVAIGALWEIYEFSLDRIFELNMQKYRQNDGTPLVGRDALFDTMKDTVIDTAGALISALFGYTALKTRENWLKKYVAPPRKDQK